MRLPRWLERDREVREEVDERQARENTRPLKSAAILSVTPMGSPPPVADQTEER